MVNEEKIKRITEWQGAGFVHPLTCGVDSGHPDLVGVDVDGDVMLQCPQCHYLQRDIPAVVFSDYVSSLKEAGFNG